VALKGKQGRQPFRVAVSDFLAGKNLLKKEWRVDRPWVNPAG
jgi:hypothetical protein